MGGNGSGGVGGDNRFERLIAGGKHKVRRVLCIVLTATVVFC
jgi:hypothetical protein